MYKPYFVWCQILAAIKILNILFNYFYDSATPFCSFRNSSTAKKANIHIINEVILAQKLKISTLLQEYCFNVLFYIITYFFLFSRVDLERTFCTMGFWSKNQIIFQIVRVLYPCKKRSSANRTFQTACFIKYQFF